MKMCAIAPLMFCVLLPPRKSVDERAAPVWKFACVLYTHVKFPNRFFVRRTYGCTPGL